MKPIHAMSILAALTASLLFTNESVRAQDLIESDPGSATRTRQELQDLLELYQGVLESPAYSGTVKETTRRRAERIRQRLSEGDFQLGDRVVLSVQGEEDLPDTLTVQSGPKITLPLFGEISLAGVLRSELEAHLTRELARFIRDPVIQAQALMRLSIQGAVRTPGFYVVPAEMLVSESLMVAGGPANNSNLEKMRIERGTTTVIEGEELQEALRQGLSLDQLNLQAGDQLILEERSTGSWYSNIGLILGSVTSVTLLVIQLMR